MVEKPTAPDTNALSGNPDLADGGGDDEQVSTSRGGLRERSAKAPQTRVGQPLSQGNLDKAIIRRYIKRVIGKISECYEKELLAQPALEGTVNVAFEITPEGKVAKSSGSGLAKVDACVAAVIQGIEFPKPQGGGTVLVNYPFVFRPAGS
jgi:outer membrane biosynthesis protein TonB